MGQRDDEVYDRIDRLYDKGSHCKREELDCDGRYALTLRNKSNGQVMHSYRCVQCGDNFESNLSAALVRRLVADGHKIIDGNEIQAAQRKFVNDHWEKRQRLYKEKRNQEAVRWRENYNLYLLSDKWKRVRDRVLHRDLNTCQAKIDGVCTRMATEVHHLNYRMLGKEPLWDLVAVCRECHKEIHRIEKNEI